MSQPTTDVSRRARIGTCASSGPCSGRARARLGFWSESLRRRFFRDIECIFPRRCVPVPERLRLLYGDLRLPLPWHVNLSEYSCAGQSVHTCALELFTSLQFRVSCNVGGVHLWSCFTLVARKKSEMLVASPDAPMTGSPLLSHNVTVRLVPCEAKASRSTVLSMSVCPPRCVVSML